MDKQMMKYVGILVGLVVLVVIVLLLMNGGGGNKNLSFDEIEDKMVSAAKKYVKDKGEDILPSVKGDSFTLDVANLVNGDYLDELSSYTKDNVSCTGAVVIYNAGNGNYDYVPELSCGSNYETKKLSTTLIGENGSNIVVEGSGLYQRLDGKFVTAYEDLYGSGMENLEYVYRGDEVNNYVKIDDNLWRVVAIDSNQNMLMILANHSKKTYAWDDKFNEEVNKSHGINTYEHNGLESNAYKTVQQFYDGEIPLMDKEEYSTKTKYLITPMDLCIGKRSPEDSDTSGAIECQEVLNDQVMGLLPAYYFMSASLDENCTSITSKSCGNYNYLASFDDFWWLLTGNSDDTYEAYSVSKKYVDVSLCKYKADIRPIIKIGSRAVYSKGDGTKDNPYTIKFYG